MMIVKYGTQFADILEGTTGNDDIYGWEAGKDANVDLGDVLKGFEGADRLWGGGGGDTLEGGDGNDRLFGDYSASGGIAPADADTLDAGQGFDELFSYSGVDHLDGGGNRDLAVIARANATTDLTFEMTSTGAVTTLTGDGTSVVNCEVIYVHGGIGDDTFTTLGGKDYLDGDAGNDTLSAGAGDDYISGGGGGDIEIGGAGDDRIGYFEADSGNDVMSGGRGEDLILGGGGADRIEGGRDNDTLYTGDTASADDGDLDTLIFAGNFGDDHLDFFADGSARFMFKGYQEQDVSIVEDGAIVTITIANGSQSGSIVILGHTGNAGLEDCIFV